MITLLFLMQAATADVPPPSVSTAREATIERDLCAGMVVPFANTPAAHAQARAASRAVAVAQAENAKGTDDEERPGRVIENDRFKMTTLEVTNVDACHQRVRVLIERKPTPPKSSD
jgi:hypothetical protein